MENTTNVVTDPGQSIFAMDGISQSRAYWPMARAAHIDLHVTSKQRVNVLLMGTDAVIDDALSRLVPNLRQPVWNWTPADPLELPSPAQSGTLILREVGAMPRIDQYRLLKWLELSGGRTQVVSTTTAPLIALVEAGAFHDTLYYRLNVVCVDVTT